MDSEVAKAFEVLCGEKSANVLIGVIKSLKTKEAEFVNKDCDWSRAFHWVEWWTCPQHLQMIHQDFTQMDVETCRKCPSDTNPVERKNQEDSKGPQPVSIQQAMINLHTAHKYICTKQLAAKVGVSASYRDLSEEGRRSSAALRQKQRLAAKLVIDSGAQFGPPD